MYSVLELKLDLLTAIPIQLAFITVPTLKTLEFGVEIVSGMLYIKDSTKRAISLDKNDLDSFHIIYMLKKVQLFGCAFVIFVGLLLTNSDYRLLLHVVILFAC